MRSASRARDTILGAIRKSLHVSGDGAPRRSAVRKRLERHPENAIPERARGGAEANLTLFKGMLKSQSATVAEVRGAEDLPDAVADYLRTSNLPAEFRSGTDDFLAMAPWQTVPSLTRLEGRGVASDAVGLSRAEVAAAETGTLFLTSGPDNPTTLNFLPDTHIAVVRKSDIVGSYEDAWRRVRHKYGAGVMPRTVNLISGPSRTADIEQVIVMGAHGPRRLHVIIVG